MRYYDPEKRSFGYTLRDLWKLLPEATEQNNQTFYIFGEDGLIDIRIEKEFSGTFTAPSYSGHREESFKYTVRVTTHLYKNSTESWEYFWVDLAD